jgi:hypothetical protein
MSEEHESPQESPAKKPRKATAPKARKAAKSAPKAERDSSGLPDVPQTPSPESLRPPEPEPKQATRLEEFQEESAGKSGWPEPETIQGSTGQPPTSGKRKRRRKKKGGQGNQVPAASGPTETPVSTPAPRREQPATEPAHQEPSDPAPSRQKPQGPRARVDSDDLAEKAWKIFQSEVAEEGLALIGDQDARELSRKSFRLAEIFLEEQSRRAR